MIRETQRDMRPIVDALEQHMQQYGYRLMETPIIEQADLFLTKAGDLVAERLFTFDRVGNNLALRPEFTAAAAHHYITAQLEGVYRWQFNGPIFEDDPNASSNTYQHASAGAELLGIDTPLADAEIVQMAASGLNTIGLDDWSIRIGHVGLTRHLLAAFDLDPRTERFILNRRGLLRHGKHGYDEIIEQLAAYVPPTMSEDFTPENDLQTQSNTRQMLNVLLDASNRGETMGGRSRHDIARRLIQKHKQSAQTDQIHAALDFLSKWVNISQSPNVAFEEIRRLTNKDSTADSILNNWETALTLMETHGLPVERIVIRPDLARTWDYYSGIVFEIHSDDKTQLAAGGRYNELTRLLGGDKAVPAVGFAFYLHHIATRLNNPLDESSGHHYLLAREAPDAAVEWAQHLRNQGFIIELVQEEADIRSTAPALIISADKTVRLGSQVYTYEHIDTLITKLRGLNRTHVE